jgi:hypothetical protein
MPSGNPSKFFAYDFKGKFARFRFGEVSATIDNDRSILISSTTQRGERQREKNTVSTYSTVARRQPSGTATPNNQ